MGEQLVPIANLFDSSSDPTLSGPPLMGLVDRWPIAPIKIARATCERITAEISPSFAKYLPNVAPARNGTGRDVGGGVGESWRSSCEDRDGAVHSIRSARR